MTIYDGTITNFATAPQSEIDIGAVGYNVQTAGKSYSLEEVDSQTARFEIQGGDHAWYDGSGVDRSELSGATHYPVGTPVNINYNFMMEPGATSTASWFVVGEVHNDDSQLPSGWSSSPPIAIQLGAGDHLQVVARYAPSGVNPNDSAGNDTVMTLWTDPNPIVRGQYHNINITYNASNTSSGYLQVSIDGTQVVNYQGPLGYGIQTYWMEGLYRSTTNQDQAADYRNLTISTGADALAAASGSTSSSGTTSGSTSGSSTTTSTTPVAPTLTVANNSLYVSPGGSIPLGLGVSVPNAGDNVTVNISGLPKYETITDKLDGKTFSGSSVTLTAAEVNSGLSLSSSYRGHGRPTATLTVTATDTTETPAMTSAAQTITVVDPPATTTSSSTSTTTAVTSSGTSTTASGDGRSWGQSHHRIDVAQSFNNHPDFARAATTLSDGGASTSGVASTPTTATTDPAAGAGAKAYALLNQMMAGDFGRESHFGQMTTALSASSQQQANLLSRPLH